MTSVSLHESSGASTASKETRGICIMGYEGSGVRPASYSGLASGDGHGEDDGSVYGGGDKREGIIPSSWFRNGSLVGLLDLGVVQAIERHPPCRLDELRVTQRGGFAVVVNVVVHVSAGGRAWRAMCAAIATATATGSRELYGAVRR